MKVTLLYPSGGGETRTFSGIEHVETDYGDTNTVYLHEDQDPELGDVIVEEAVGLTIDKVTNEMPTVNAEPPQPEPGWYEIGQDWELYVDGELQTVHVSYVHVEKKHGAPGYWVKHFGPDGYVITRLGLEADDFGPEILAQDPCERPSDAKFNET